MPTHSWSDASIFQGTILTWCSLFRSLHPFPKPFACVAAGISSFSEAKYWHKALGLMDEAQGTGLQILGESMTCKVSKAVFSGSTWRILDLRSHNWDMEVLNFDWIWIVFCWIFCHYLLLHQKNRGKHSTAWMLWLFGHIHVEWHGFMNGLKTGPNPVSNQHLIFVAWVVRLFPQFSSGSMWSQLAP